MPDARLRQSVVRGARRIVVKLGTAALTDRAGRLDVGFVRDFSGQASAAMDAGVEVVLVSSGAIGAGMGELDLPARPETLPLLQATAAVGQGLLMRAFHDAFERFGVAVAQVLVTRGDFEDRRRYLNIRNTLAALHEFRAVPVVNENDTVAVEELEMRFGDNDIVAALVANMLGADLLIMLTVVDGVMDGGRVLDVVTDPAAAGKLATGARTRLGSGGMGAKLKAAEMVAAAGEAAIIANARQRGILTRLLACEPLGTLCVPAPARMSGRRRWIGFAARAAGKIVVDDGAAAALTRKGSSLLPSGIVAVTGRFKKGDTVAIVDAAGRQIARGLSNYDADQVDAIKGLKTSRIAAALGEKPYDEVVHRNNMTLA